MTEVSGGGITAVWAEAPKCAHCDTELIFQSVHVEDFPYLHADIRFKCGGCGEVFLHGVPRRKEVGLALHVLDTNPKAAVGYQVNAGTRKCPYKGHGNMLPTKVFGDWVLAEEKVEYQWKCPSCFLTRHELHKRRFKHGEGYNPLSEEDKKIIMERLRRMGYVE